MCFFRGFELEVVDYEGSTTMFSTSALLVVTQPIERLTIVTQSNVTTDKMTSQSVIRNLSHLCHPSTRCSSRSLRGNDQSESIHDLTSFDCWIPNRL